jgi:tetratricopeptide (TPR) repeat protein
MTARKRTTVIAAGCLAISMVASIFLLWHLDQIRPQATLDDSLYISSPKMVKRASLGFDGMMACIYWTRTVQYFGDRLHTRARSFNELAPLLTITTALDPHLFPAYEFGASFLAPPPPHGAGQPARAIELMEYGIQHNPDNWRLYYDLGFVYYTELKDYKKAAEVFEQGSKVPNAHPFLKVLAADMAFHAGDLSTARLLWSATYESSHDKLIRQNAIEHLRAIKVEEDITQLESAVTRFGTRAGRTPSSMWELALAEHLSGIPVDPDGHAYLLTLDGHIMVENPGDFNFLTKGVPPGYRTPALPQFHVEHNQ